jgi:hypothetical protein
MDALIAHEVRVHPSADRLPREAQLAWKIAEVATGGGAVEPAVAAMAACRVVDNAAVALAAVNRAPVAAARAMALAHPRAGGARLFGLPEAVRVDAEWAAWANATAVRELDFHDTFLAADYAHPGDSIAPLLAVAEQTGRDGAALVRAIAVAYEIHVALVKAICLHQFKKDHVAHLAPGDGGRHRRPARPADAGRLQRGQPGGPPRLLDPAVAQGRDQLVEGVRAGLFRQAGDRGGGPRDARRGRPRPDLRGRGFGHRLDAVRARRALHRPPAGPRPAAPRHPRDLHQGALGRYGPGADRRRGELGGRVDLPASPRSWSHQPPYPT